jgi:hypothetical protein
MNKLHEIRKRLFLNRTRLLGISGNTVICFAELGAFHFAQEILVMGDDDQLKV